MCNEVLILVDEAGMDVYEGRIDGLKKSHTKWGFTLDETFNTMTFRGDLGVLGKLTEFHMDYFDKNQALGKEFLYIICDSLDEGLRDDLSKFPIFDYGFWIVYDIPAHILLVHRSSQINDPDDILRQSGAMKIFGLSYFIPKNSLNLLSAEFAEGGEVKMKFSLFKCYPIGNLVSIDVWKKSFYKLH